MELVNSNSYNVNDGIDDSIPKYKHPSGIPGRLFVLPFVSVLVVLGTLMFAVAVRFQTIMARLEVVRSEWPRASQELGQRYDRFNDSFAASTVAEAIKENWTNNRREFKVSSQFDRQSVASLAIERQIRQSLEGSLRSESDFELPGISKLIEAESRRKKSQDDILGWLTVQGLRLKLPPIYAPQANNP